MKWYASLLGVINRVWSGVINEIYECNDITVNGVVRELMMNQKLGQYAFKNLLYCKTMFKPASLKNIWQVIYNDVNTFKEKTFIGLNYKMFCEKHGSSHINQYLTW